MYDTTLLLDEKGDLMQNHIRGWKLGHEKGSDWCAVVQDDVKLTGNFPAKLETNLLLAEQNGFGVVTLYSNYGEDVVALANGKRWRARKGRRFLNEQFLLMNHEVVEKYIKYVDAHGEEISLMGNWHDVVLSRFFAENKLDVFIALPNLVDHLPVKSTVGHSSRVGGIERRSRTFVED